MGARLTHTDLLGLQDVVKLGGDLLLLPREEPLPYEEARALEMAGLIEKKSSSVYDGVVQAMQLAERYCSERNGDEEPAWVETLPMSVRVTCRLHYALTQEDPLAIVGRLPFTGISYMVTDDGLCDLTARLFNLFRLSHIKQLGFLQAPYYGEEGRYSYLKGPLSESTRWNHSLDVMTIAKLLAHNTGLSERRTNELTVAALSHDTGTPAGGDSVKLVDFENLDEDINYPEIIGKIAWEKMRPYGVRKSEVIKAVQGKGLLGELLDIADKLAYIARDVDRCRHHFAVGLEADQLGLRTLTGLIERHPYVCGIWDSVIIRDGHACFTDIRRLVAFLKVRVLMFRELYYHPVSRFGEYFISRLLVKTLYDQGKLTKEKLLTMDDGSLLRQLDEEFGTGYVIDLCSTGIAKCESFKTLEDAQAFRKSLMDSGNIFTMLDDDRRLIKTGANLHVATEDGVKPLSEADPASARELTEMATMLPMVKVYYLDGMPDLPPEKLARLVDHLRKHPIP